MNKAEFLDTLTRCSVDYRRQALESIWRNRHMNGLTNQVHVDSAVIDALLVDFVNFVGHKMGVDYGLYARDLSRRRWRPPSQL